jgi:hypothetical protein
MGIVFLSRRAIHSPYRSTLARVLTVAQRILCANAREVTENWDEQVLRIGETVPMKSHRSTSSRKFHAAVPG